MRTAQLTISKENIRKYGTGGAVLLAYLDTLAPDQDGWIAVSDRQIERETGMSYRAIRRAVCRLSRSSLLEIHREPRKTPRYRFAHADEQALPCWQELTRVYPERHEPHHLSEAYRIFCQLVREGEDPRRIVQAAKIYRLEQDARAKRRGQGTGSKYVKELSNWLSERLYLKYFTEEASVPKHAKPTHEPKQEPVPTEIIPHTDGHAKPNGDAPPIAVSRADEVLLRLGINPALYKRA
jgi:hypothetical protein